MARRANLPPFLFDRVLLLDLTAIHEVGGPSAACGRRRTGVRARTGPRSAQRAAERGTPLGGRAGRRPSSRRQRPAQTAPAPRPPWQPGRERVRQRRGRPASVTTPSRCRDGRARSSRRRHRPRRDPRGRCRPVGTPQCLGRRANRRQGRRPARRRGAPRGPGDTRLPRRRTCRSGSRRVPRPLGRCPPQEEQAGQVAQTGPSRCRMQCRDLLDGGARGSAAVSTRVRCAAGPAGRAATRLRCPRLGDRAGHVGHRGSGDSRGLDAIGQVAAGAGVAPRGGRRSWSTGRRYRGSRHKPPRAESIGAADHPKA